MFSHGCFHITLLIYLYPLLYISIVVCVEISKCIMLWCNFLQWPMLLNQYILSRDWGLLKSNSCLTKKFTRLSRPVPFSVPNLPYRIAVKRKKGYPQVCYDHWVQGEKGDLKCSKSNKIPVILVESYVISADLSRNLQAFMFITIQGIRNNCLTHWYVLRNAPSD